MDTIRKELSHECNRDDCFLCRPNAALIAHVGEVAYTLSGLGPLAEGYAVVATSDHLQGLREADADFLMRYATYANRVAVRLAEYYGGCLLLEHGNMAVCGVAEEGRAHCFHPHFLLIPTTRANVDPFTNYFEKSVVFDSLGEAISFGADKGQYVLVGQPGGVFHIFFPVGEVPRQFARGLVAEQLGIADLASWKSIPDLLGTLKNAKILRKVLAS